jgi:ABC-type spermidine/putrescine transport system permease subunit I
MSTSPSGRDLNPRDLRTGWGNSLKTLARRIFLLLPVVFLSVFLLLPLLFMVVISFWKRAMLKMEPAFVLSNYFDFLGGTRLIVLGRSFIVSTEATVIGLTIAYPIAYILARRARPTTARSVLLLFTVPFLVNYIIRAFAWTYLLGRTGPINSALMATGLRSSPVDWLLYSDFGVLVGMVSSYMPFMIFPLWMSIVGIDKRLSEASSTLGATPTQTFRRVTLPLSLPGVFAAIIFSFVGCFGESAVPTILGGVGYQLIGNEITSTLDVLNYPLAAAMSSIVTAVMLVLLVVWNVAFDLRSFLGKILAWRIQP